MKAVLTENAPQPAGHYSQAMIHGNTVYISGQLAIDPKTGEKRLGSIEEQTEQALKNMAAILAATGTDMAHVVKCTVLLADIDTFKAMNTVYGTFFPDAPPARAAFAVKDLPLGALVEIEAIAVLPD